MNPKKTITFALLLLGLGANAQSINDTVKVQAIMYNGEFVPFQTLESVSVMAKLTDEQRKRMAEYNRLRNAVYVTYPYARTAGVLLNDINDKISKMDSRRDRKSYIRTREDELKREFTKPIKNLSTFQGKVLMKLINRETGNSCYEIIKDYRGGFVAGAYQTVAYFFKTSLKQPYEANDEDATLERIVREVQRLYGYPEIARKGES
jgi:hypothetical protein